ncbi:hypothetical protein BDC45DRAFT_541971 [Circinella umbellata]|nr:hypothetical protein BDC45DRAFT_541971 [Circinella umbellata]
MIRFLIPIILMIFTILSHYHGDAYCIYNKVTDGTYVHVDQVGGQDWRAKGASRFSHHKMTPGSSECCPYTSTDCSATADKNAIVNFKISYGEVLYFFYNRRDISCPAGGSIVVTGAYGDLAFESFDADHNSVGKFRTKP